MVLDQTACLTTSNNYSMLNCLTKHRDLYSVDIRTQSFEGGISPSKIFCAGFWFRGWGIPIKLQPKKSTFSWKVFQTGHFKTCGVVEKSSGIVQSPFSNANTGFVLNVWNEPLNFVIPSYRILHILYDIATSFFILQSM